MYASDRVLLFGHDDMLLMTRGWLLETVGFKVWSAKDLGSAAETIVAQQIDALILCQTLSAEERSQAMIVAEEARPETKILVMEDEFARCPAGRGAFVLETVAPPVDFLAAVQQMTGQNGAVSGQV